jgi:hypothetical protein
MELECQSCHKMKDESIMDFFDGIFNLCIECNNPDKWKQIQLREKWHRQYNAGFEKFLNK